MLVKMPPLLFWPPSVGEGFIPPFRAKASACIAEQEGGINASPSLSKKPRRVCRRWRQIESNPFSAGAHPRVASLAPSEQFTFCTWQKTLLRLQVWNLSPIGGQIMRAAGCQSLSEKPKGVFRQSQGGINASPTVYHRFFMAPFSRAGFFLFTLPFACTKITVKGGMRYGNV